MLRKHCFGLVACLEYHQDNYSEELESGHKSDNGQIYSASAISKRH